MATYNFTVRATDNFGAYADRSFNLEVNNTDISRFVVVGSTGLAHSVDGSTWNLESGLSGLGVTYGNGQWVVWGGLDTSVIRTSPDAISWTTTAATFSGTPEGYYHTAAAYFAGTGSTVSVESNGLSMIKWIGDRWVGMTRAIYRPAASAFAAALEYSSVDAVNWTFQRIVHDNVAWGANGLMGLQDFEYDAHSDTWIAVVATTNQQSIIKTRVGSGSWTTTFPSAGNVSTGYNGSMGASIINVNGLWVVVCKTTTFGGQSAPAFTSADGLNWTPRTTGGSGNVGCSGMLYVNGRLMTFTEGGVTSTTQLYTSTNAGRTWASWGSGTGIGTMRETNRSYSQIAAYYAGTLLFIGSTSSTIRRSVNDGSSVQAVALPAIGASNAIYARQS